MELFNLIKRASFKPYKGKSKCWKNNSTPKVRLVSNPIRESQNYTDGYYCSFNTKCFKPYKGKSKFCTVLWLLFLVVVSNPIRESQNNAKRHFKGLEKCFKPYKGKSKSYQLYLLCRYESFKPYKGKSKFHEKLSDYA